MPTNFARVKQILNNEMTKWRGDPANSDDNAIDLVKVHHEPTFPRLDGDFTAADLIAGKARGRDLIQKGTDGKFVAGTESNLYRVLKAGLPGIERMPGGGAGPYIADSELAEIAEWIDTLNAGAG